MFYWTLCGQLLFGAAMFWFLDEHTAARFVERLQTAGVAQAAVLAVLMFRSGGRRLPLAVAVIGVLSAIPAWPADADPVPGWAWLVPALSLVVLIGSWLIGWKYLDKLPPEPPRPVGTPSWMPSRQRED